MRLFSCLVIATCLSSCATLAFGDCMSPSPTGDEKEDFKTLVKYADCVVAQHQQPTVVVDPFPLPAQGTLRKNYPPDSLLLAILSVNTSGGTQTLVASKGFSVASPPLGLPQRQAGTLEVDHDGSIIATVPPAGPGNTGGNGTLMVLVKASDSQNKPQ